MERHLRIQKTGVPHQNRMVPHHKNLYIQNSGVSEFLKKQDSESPKKKQLNIRKNQSS